MDCIQDEVVTSYVAEGEEERDEDMSVPLNSLPPAEEVGNVTVNIEAFLQTKDEPQLRTLCLELLRRHPEDIQGIIEEHGDPDENDPGDDLDWCNCRRCREMPIETEYTMKCYQPSVLPATSAIRWTLQTYFDVWLSVPRQVVCGQLSLVA
ncbi:hypothetical protein HOLleu_10837 [Holothuria leucospilota]|uniref:Uncharacterized protein n=1 Tax=Holothuria leucospilota TaxID=206669 RepID=A0A9Q1HG15_HOLLE|nr:hypothetical protein HOLleu_10837 [Holothuria leucospilota]